MPRRNCSHPARAALCALVWLLAGGGCRREAPPTLAVDAGAAPASLTAGVEDPWRWPRARSATPLEQAIEDIGPY